MGGEGEGVIPFVCLVGYVRAVVALAIQTHAAEMVLVRDAYPFVPAGDASPQLVRKEQVQRHRDAEGRAAQDCFALSLLGLLDLLVGDGNLGVAVPGVVFAEVICLREQRPLPLG